VRQLHRVSVVGVVVGVLCWTAVATAPTLAAGRSADTSRTNAFFYGVACASASSCEAVGAWLYPTRVGAESNLAEHWNGSKWTVQTVPRPKRASLSELLGVACPSAKSCFAVGYYNVSATATAPLADRWNGSKWEVQPLVQPHGSDGVLQAIACQSVHSCMAVGDYETTDGNLQNLSEHWNGTKWSVQRPAVASGSVNELLGVACTSTASCTAVGQEGEIQATFADHWNGAKWTVQSTPNPPGMSTPGLSGVACRASAMCMAVGASDYGVEMYTLAERWNGSSWVIVKTEDPSTATHPNNSLVAVSCPSISRCIAVGHDSNASNTFVTLAESWNGSKWSAVSIPGSPAGAENQLTAVSCASRSSCMAVGYAQSSSFTGGATVAERWNGSRWTVVSTPAP